MSTDSGSAPVGTTGGPYAATVQELAQGARDHYERISMAACDWLSTIPQAIDAWEREVRRTACVHDVPAGNCGTCSSAPVGTTGERRNGWRMSEPTYIARCRECGGITAAVVDRATRKAEIATYVAEWIRDGDVVERVEADRVRSDGFSCSCPPRRRTPSAPVADAGAVDLQACPSRNGCQCGRCAVCGFALHMAIHGPVYGAEPGSKPWGHEFQAAPVADAGRQDADAEWIAAVIRDEHEQCPQWAEVAAERIAARLRPVPPREPTLRAAFKEWVWPHLPPDDADMIWLDFAHAVLAAPPVAEPSEPQPFEAYCENCDDEDEPCAKCREVMDTRLGWSDLYPGRAPVAVAPEPDEWHLASPAELAAFLKRQTKPVAVAPETAERREQVRLLIDEYEARRAHLRLGYEDDEGFPDAAVYADRIIAAIAAPAPETAERALEEIRSAVVAFWAAGGPTGYRPKEWERAASDFIETIRTLSGVALAAPAPAHPLEVFRRNVPAPICAEQPSAADSSQRTKPNEPAAEP